MVRQDDAAAGKIVECSCPGGSGWQLREAGCALPDVEGRLADRAVRAEFASGVLSEHSACCSGELRPEPRGLWAGSAMPGQRDWHTDHGGRRAAIGLVQGGWPSAGCSALASAIMKPWGFLLLLTVSFGIVPSVFAASCPVPDPFVIADDALPAAKQAIAGHALTVLVLGGAATLGGPANGTEFTYPSRLTARLREAFPGLTVRMVVHAVTRQSDSDLEKTLDAALA